MSDQRVEELIEWARRNYRQMDHEAEVHGDEYKRGRASAFREMWGRLQAQET